MTAKPFALGKLSETWQLSHAGLTLRCAGPGVDMARIAVLRDQCFGAGPSGAPNSDDHDAKSLHLLVETAADRRLLAACRVRFHADAQSACQGYTGQFYDLAGLDAIGFPMLELGRLCTLRPTDGRAEGQAAGLRLIWAGLADLVGRWGAKAIFGCASFAGADPAPHRTALGQMAVSHSDPKGVLLRARVAASSRVELAAFAAKGGPASLPPLLRSYLSLGAWVGPDGVLDAELDTLHVLTVLQIDRVPAARRAALTAFVALLGGHPVDGPPQSA